MLYSGKVSTSYETKYYDELWTLPSFNRSNAWYEVVYRTKVKVAPFLWSPLFFRHVIEALPSRHYYEPRSEKTVATFEPNINVVKTAVLPLSILELAHRAEPGLISKAYITNTGNLVKQPDVKKFVFRSLSIYKDHRLFFEQRYRFGWFLSQYADVVLSHQWKNELNYLFIEALYAGYPLVHNSPYFADCGYYYPASDGYAGRDALIRALKTHDDNLESYNEQVCG